MMDIFSQKECFKAHTDVFTQKTELKNGCFKDKNIHIKAKTDVLRLKTFILRQK